MGNDLDYSSFVGLVDERNRPSGGIKTIQMATINARIDSSSKVLEIGSNTGFTAVNIKLLTNAEVVGIDINQDSIKNSKKYALSMGADVNFLKASATDLPFEDHRFDMIWASNTTSFIQNKTEAIKQYLRVLKPGGTLAVVPIYYREVPPKELVDDISTAIASDIEVWSKSDWVDMFVNGASKSDSALELYFEKDFCYEDQRDRIKEYVDYLFSNSESIKSMSKKQSEELKERAKYFYNLFNTSNFGYAGFSILLFQKRQATDQMELFTTKEI